MKRSILTLMIAMTITCVPAGLNAQGIPVYDNTNFISFVKSLLESGKQTANLMKTVKFLKQQKENLDKVNNAIKQLNAVKEMAKNNERLYNTVQNDLRDILNSPYIRPEEVGRVSESFNNILEGATATMDYIDQVLSSDSFKMTDGERAAILKAKEVQSQEMVADIESKTRRYREIISFRKMQETINNREAAQ